MGAVYTFGDLHGQVLSWLDQAGDTSTTITNVKAALNHAHQARLAQEPWPFLLYDEDPLTFTLTSGERFYTLHPDLWRLDYLYNQTSKAFLIETPRRELTHVGDAWSSDTGRTPFYRLQGVSHVAAQPTSASVITIVSSSASDTGSGNAISIHGYANGAPNTESITPNGTSSVAGTTQFTRVLSVTKAAAWTGTLTVTANSGAVTVLTLLAGEYGRSYRKLELLRAPTSGDTLDYRFFRLPRKLVNDNDLPDIPPPHSGILVWDTLLLLSTYHEMPAGAVKVWAGFQQDLEADMRRMWLEGSALEAHPRHIRYTGDEDGVPRIFGA